MAKQDYDRFSQPLGACGLNNVYCRSCENAVIGKKHPVFDPNNGSCQVYETKPDSVFEHGASCKKYVRKTSDVKTDGEQIHEILEEIKNGTLDWKTAVERYCD